jgi:hypothetical protein
MGSDPWGVTPAEITNVLALAGRNGQPLIPARGLVYTDDGDASRQIDGGLLLE